MLDHIKELAKKLIETNDYKNFGPIRAVVTEIYKEIDKLEVQDFEASHRSDFLQFRAAVSRYVTTTGWSVGPMKDDLGKLVGTLDYYQPSQVRRADTPEASKREGPMNVILTWSGKPSHEIAMFLKEWLRDVLPSVKPWVSTEDIQKGKKWFPELMAKFDETSFSITCVTAENVRSPWVYYEVGLIASKQEKAIMCPYLVGVSAKHISGTPISQFQCTEADKTDTWRLIRSINTELKEKGYDEAVLEGNFKSHWPKLKAKLDKIIGEMDEIEDEITQVVQPPTPGLGKLASKILIEASRDEDGQLLFVENSEGKSVQTNGKDLLPSQSGRDVAMASSAIDQLVQLGYFEPPDLEGGAFTLTGAGYERADALIAADPILSMTTEAKELLLAATDDENGCIMMLHTSGGLCVQANSKNFVGSGDPQLEATWKAAVEDLLALRAIEHRGNKGEIFGVTKEGYRIAKELR